MQTSAAAKGRALVIGSSMAGLFATALLRRAGWEADVFEEARSSCSGEVQEL